jgi:hypothetical protein
MANGNENDFDELSKHAYRAVVSALGIVLLGAGFSGLELLFAKWDFPGYVVFGTRFVAIGLFIVDGIAVLGITSLLAFRYVATVYYHVRADLNETQRVGKGSKDE